MIRFRGLAQYLNPTPKRRESQQFEELVLECANNFFLWNHSELAEELGPSFQMFQQQHTTPSTITRGVTSQT